MADEGVICEAGVLRSDRVAGREAPRGGTMGCETVWCSRQVDWLILLAFDACADHDVVGAKQARELVGESHRASDVTGRGQAFEGYVEHIGRVGVVFRPELFQDAKLVPLIDGSLVWNADVLARPAHGCVDRPDADLPRIDAGEVLVFLVHL